MDGTLAVVRRDAGDDVVVVERLVVIQLHVGRLEVAEVHRQRQLEAVAVDGDDGAAVHRPGHR